MEINLLVLGVWPNLRSLVSLKVVSALRAPLFWRLASFQAVDGWRSRPAGRVGESGLHVGRVPQERLHFEVVFEQVD